MERLCFPPCPLPLPAAAARAPRPGRCTAALHSRFTQSLTGASFCPQGTVAVAVADGGGCEGDRDGGGFRAVRRARVEERPSPTATKEMTCIYESGVRPQESPPFLPVLLPTHGNILRGDRSGRQRTSHLSPAASLEALTR